MFHVGNTNRVAMNFLPDLKTASVVGWCCKCGARPGGFIEPSSSQGHVLERNMHSMNWAASSNVVPLFGMPHDK